MLYGDVGGTKRCVFVITIYMCLLFLGKVLRHCVVVCAVGLLVWCWFVGCNCGTKRCLLLLVLSHILAK